MKDSELLEIYMEGFYHERNNDPEAFYYNPIKMNAYMWGRIDAKLGDENHNIDYESDDIKLDRIKNHMWYQE